MNNLYKEHLIYKYTKNAIMIYVCLEDIKLEKFAVHQMEFVNEVRIQTVFNEMRILLLENMIFEDPMPRLTWFDSIQSAIDAHDCDFGN